MSRRDSSDSLSSDATPAAPTPLCVICEQAAVGVGPFSRCHLCQQHLSVDVADAHKLKEEVAEQLRAYSQGAGAASGVAALELGVVGEDAPAGSLRLHIRQHLQQVEQRFDQVQRDLDSFRSRVTGQLESLLEALSVCELDLEDVSSYKQEVATAEAAGDMSELVYLAESMQVSLGDLEADFERAARLQRESSDSAELQLRLLGQLERLVDSCAEGADATDGTRDAAVTAISDEIDAAVRERMLLDPIVFSHEVKLDSGAQWLAVCSDTSGFVGDRSSRVVPADSVREGRKALPQPCIIASFDYNKDHLLVLSVDGSQKLRCHCDIDWKEYIFGLHCDRQLLFIAQPDAVTVTDLSGRAVRRIRPRVEGFGGIGGIGGNAASVFVSSGNKIAAFSKATGQMETVITLSQLPDAQLGNLAIHNNCIHVTDCEHKQVHRVRIDTQQLVASHPTQRSGLQQFAVPVSVAFDRRGRLFMIEYWGHSVRAVASDDGSLLAVLGTLEVPGESGSGDDKLNSPWGLAVVTVVDKEKLVVSDPGNNRLLVVTLNADLNAHSESQF